MAREEKTCGFIGDSGMREYILGKLPESFSSLARFRPADSMDFGRRAKVLAKFLEMPLQAAQHTLARAYGYAHLHELQQALKQEDAPAGPYDDQLFSILGTSNEDADLQLRYYRQERLMRFITDWAANTQDRYLQNTDMLACDLGLFSSPAAHRIAAKSVNEFLDTESGFTIDGFPFGFNGALHSRYRLWNLPFAENCFESFYAAPDYPWGNRLNFDPRFYLRKLRERRAPQLFYAMVEEAAPHFLEETPDIELESSNFENMETAALLQYTYNWEISWHLLRLYESKHAVDLAEDTAELAKLEAALCEPTDERISACVLTKDLPDFRQKLAHWRLSLRLQLAQALIEDEYEDYYDYQEEPTVIVSGYGNHAMYILMEPASSVEDIRRWHISATLMLEDEKTGLWSPAGILQGDYIVPYIEGRYSGPRSLLSYFDDRGDDELYRVWQLLPNTYLPRAGYDSYDEWVNEIDGSALANLSPWISPSYRGKGVAKFIFECFVKAFEEWSADSWDKHWQKWARPQENDNGTWWDDMDEHPFEPLSVIFVPLHRTGILGYSIWEGDAEHASGQLIRVNGESVRRESRLMRSVGGTVERKGLGWHMLREVKSIAADFVLYDPESKYSFEE